MREAHRSGDADEQELRRLFDEYLQMYASRDERLTSFFSENFSGFTGGGDFLVKDRAEWVAITRQDFAQVTEPIRIDLKDVALQSLSDTIAVTTGFFVIHLPIPEHFLSRTTARLVLIWRKEGDGWKIAHSSISIPDGLVQEGEVYPLKELVERNRLLEREVAERTAQLSEANDRLRQSNEELAREIEERRAAETALRDSEVLHRSILLASPDDITITDARGHILMASPAAQKLFGPQTESEFVGRSVLEYLVPEDRERAAARLARRVEGEVSGPSEYRGLRADGSAFDVEVNTAFIRDAEGVLTGMVVIVRDISERKRAEAERERLEAQNRQLQKSESLGRMAGAIAHHFNNQLHAIMMSLDLAIDEQVRRGIDVDLTRMARDSAAKASEMSGLMLTYLGHRPARTRSLDLSDICERSLPLLRTVMPENVELRTTLSSPGPVVEADPDLIQHALTNLVTNAWEANGKAGGSVRIEVSTVAASDISARHRFPIDARLRDGTYACLAVADSGPGIPEENIEKIFDPFFSSRLTGRGMGLAVVLGIARAHGAVVTVQTAPGAGSTFRLFLPVKPPTGPSAAAT